MLRMTVKWDISDSLNCLEWNGSTLAFDIFFGILFNFLFLLCQWKKVMQWRDGDLLIAPLWDEETYFYRTIVRWWDISSSHHGQRDRDPFIVPLWDEETFFLHTVDKEMKISLSYQCLPLAQAKENTKKWSSRMEWNCYF